MLTEDQAWWVLGAMLVFIAFGSWLQAGWWAVLQIFIFMAVVGSNIQWHWTPNGYVASIIGFAAAFVGTAAISGLLRRLRPSQETAE